PSEEVVDPAPERARGIGVGAERGDEPDEHEHDAPDVVAATVERDRQARTRPGVLLLGHSPSSMDRAENANTGTIRHTRNSNTMRAQSSPPSHARWRERWIPRGT